MVTLFYFLRNFQNIFQSDRTIFTFPSEIYKDSSFSISLPALTIVYLIYYSILVSVKRFLIAALTCISLITNNVEHLFMCTFSFFFGEIFIHILCPLNNWLVFLLLNCESSHNFLFYYLPD